MRTDPSFSLMPPAFVTSSTQSWMPSVWRFDVTFCAPVCDAVNPMIRSFVTVAWLGAADVPPPGDVPPHADATSPTSTSVRPTKRMLLIVVLLFQGYVRRILLPRAKARGPSPAVPTRENRWDARSRRRAPG